MQQQSPPELTHNRKSVRVTRFLLGWAVQKRYRTTGSALTTPHYFSRDRAKTQMSHGRLWECACLNKKKP